MSMPKGVKYNRVSYYALKSTWSWKLMQIFTAA